MANSGVHDIDNFIGQMVINQQQNELSLTPATSADLSEDSGYNQQFYGASTGTPKLVYWGNEASPIHVRFFAGSGGLDEENTVSKFHEVRQFYGLIRDIDYTLRWTFIWLYPYYNWMGNGWAEGYDYLADQSESEWSNLIGAGFSFTQPVTYLRFIGTDLAAYDQCVSDANGNSGDLAICESTYFQWVTENVTFFVREASDGLVPRRSQIGENTAWTNSNAEVRELSNNNHSEMRRSNESRSEIIEAFNGNRSNGAFFVPPI